MFFFVILSLILGGFLVNKCFSETPLQLSLALSLCNSLLSSTMSRSCQLGLPELQTPSPPLRGLWNLLGFPLHRLPFKTLQSIAGVIMIVGFVCFFFFSDHCLALPKKYLFLILSISFTVSGRRENLLPVNLSWLEEVTKQFKILY